MSPSKEQSNLQPPRFIRASYEKFDRLENQYQFSKFGNLTDECKDNFFDSFLITPTPLLTHLSIRFACSMKSALSSFDSLTADNSESDEYYIIHHVLKDLKKFVMNKFDTILEFDQPFGQPLKKNQDLLKHSGVL